MKLLKRFPVVATPSHLAYSPDSSTVFVSLQDSDKLAAFDLRTMTEKWIVPIGKTPAGVLWLNGQVLVADMGTDYLAARRSGRPARSWPTSRPARGRISCSCRRMARSSGSTTAPAAPPSRSTATTLKPIRTYNIPGGPDDLAFAPNGKIWITRRWAEKVAVLDPATGDYRDDRRRPIAAWIVPEPERARRPRWYPAAK